MEIEKQKKRLSFKEAYVKAAAYCAYQERTQQHVRDKLYSYGLITDEVEELITQLIGEKFINEERFAKSFASGKFRIKKWGKLKIKAALKFEGLSDYCIKKGIAEIDPDEYIACAKKIIADKSKKITEKHPFKRKHKIVSYLLSRGYENDLIWELLNEN